MPNLPALKPSYPTHMAKRRAFRAALRVAVAELNAAPIPGHPDGCAVIESSRASGMPRFSISILSPLKATAVAGDYYASAHSPAEMIVFTASALRHTEAGSRARRALTHAACIASTPILKEV